MPRTSTADPNILAQGFHALSEPTRLEILELLRGGERCQCELTGELDVAQSRLSFHMKVLKDAGLISDRREGRWVYYTLNTEVLSELGEFIAEVETSGKRFGAGKGCCS